MFGVCLTIVFECLLKFGKYVHTFTKQMCIRDSPSPPREQITFHSESPAPSVTPAKPSQTCLPESWDSSWTPVDPLTAWAENLVASLRSAPDTTTVLALVFQSLSTLFPVLPLNMPRSLRIVAWNAHGVGPRWSELMTFVMEYDADVVLLCDTHLAHYHNLTLPLYLHLLSSGLSPSVLRGLSLIHI